MSRALISIIVPTYNCFSHISHCINSILVQTLTDFELIIVDDGSTDGTCELARQYAAEHENVFVYQQDHAFAGVARNLGLSKATGEYVLFLDGDDYFEPALLEHTYDRIRETDADICVFGANWLNDKTGEVKPMSNACRSDLCPCSATFNRRTNPRYIFCFTTPAPWTKLYRKSFIEENSLRFQDIRSANDLRFTFTSLAIAEKIAILDENLVIYRRENNSSLQSTQGRDPFAFYHALVSLRQELQTRGVFSEVRHAYVNAALDMCMYNLRTLKNSPEAQRQVFDFLNTKGFSSLEISGKPQSYFYIYPDSRYSDYLLVRAGDFERYRAAIDPSATRKRSVKDRLRSIIPLRASAFEKSKKSLYREIDVLKEQNRDLSEKLSKCLELLQEMK